MGSFCCCGHGAENAPFPRSEGRKVLHRAPTDVVFTVLFWAFVAIMTWCVVDGYTTGDVRRLTHGADWEGQICGIDNTRPFMMFCGSPERETVNGVPFPKFIIEGSTVCVEECPTRATAPSKTIDCLMPAYHNFTAWKNGTIGRLKNVETLEMTLTQSVTTQVAYPTQAYGGRFCLPSSDNEKLRDMIIEGPWGHHYRPMVTIGGLGDAWPLFAIAAAVAILLGSVYMLLLGRFAGVLIFGTMIISTLFILALGFFFFFAVVMDMDNTSSDYSKFNPIMSVFIGKEAQIYSVITGVILILIGVICGAISYTSVKAVDEIIGLVSASCECLDAGGMLKLFPIAQALVFCVIFYVFWFTGLQAVMSMGYLDYSEISVDGEGVNGLQRVWKRTWLQHKELWFYIAGIFFLLEFYIQFGHYMVAYTVCSWFFTEGREVKVNNVGLVDRAIGQGFGKKVEVRVAGVDPNYGPRQGSVVQTEAGKMLVVPVGKKGPGLGRLDMEDTKFVKDPVACGSMTLGAMTAIVYHIGTIALACPIIFFLRPFQMISKLLSLMLLRTKEPDESWQQHNPHSRPSDQKMRNSLSLFSACLDQVFGKFSKDALTECVLNGESGFVSCSITSFSFLVKSGGSVAHLHGCMLMYELFGCLFITTFCGWMTLIIQDKVDWFNDPTGPYYIEDKNASVIAACAISFAIAFAFMSTWNQIADVLLYCVAWNRKQLKEGQHMKLPRANSGKPNCQIQPVSVYCPQNLRYLLPEHERNTEYEGGLKSAEAMGHAMQILTTMEHGASTQMGGTMGSMAPHATNFLSQMPGMGHGGH